MVIVCDGKRIVARPADYELNTRGGLDYETITFGLETRKLAPAGDGDRVTAEVDTEEFPMNEAFKLAIYTLCPTESAKGGGAVGFRSPPLHTC